MKIIDKNELAKMPNGTLFCRYKPDYLVDEFKIITGHYNNGFNGILSLEPSFHFDQGEMRPETIRITNWATVDTCDYDFDEHDLFAVFSKAEIRAMITVLQYALSDCSFNINKFMDTYYCDEQEIDEKELESWIGE